MFEELTAGQVFDWEQFHRQFNLCFDKEDRFWALALADFRNANRGEDDPETRAIDMLPWVDAYGDDDAFLSQMRMIAGGIQADSEPKKEG